MHHARPQAIQRDPAAQAAYDAEFAAALIRLHASTFAGQAAEATAAVEAKWASRAAADTASAEAESASRAAVATAAAAEAELASHAAAVGVQSAAEEKVAGALRLACRQGRVVVEVAQRT